MRIIKFSVTAIFFGLAESQGQLLACAQYCVTKATSDVGVENCPTLDMKCVCSSPKFSASVACCGLICNENDRGADGYAMEICMAVGITPPIEPVLCLNPTSTWEDAASTSGSGVLIPSATPTTYVTSIRSTSSTQDSRTATANSLVSPTSTNLPSSSPAGLSTGATAGISIGVAILIILIALAIFFCYRRRHRGKGSGALGNQLTELPTAANTHELHASQARKQLSRKPNIEQHLPEAIAYEIYGDNSGPELVEEKNIAEIHGGPELVEEKNIAEMYSKPELVGEKNIAEIDSNPVPTTVYFVTSKSASPTDLWISPIVREPEVMSRYTGSTVAVSQVSNSSLLDIEGSGGPSASRLDILHSRIDRVRAEKERLAKMQELDELEAALQREIMEEQTKETRQH